MVRVLLATLITTAVLALAACSGGDDNTDKTAAGASSAPSSSTTEATSGSGGGAGSLQAGGALEGAVTVQNISCAPPGGQALVSIAATIGGDSYGIGINATRAGTYELGAGTPGILIQISSQSSSGTPRTWIAGFGEVRGSGTVTIGEQDGSIDATLDPSTGTTGSVQLKGSWTCD